MTMFAKAKTGTTINEKPKKGKKVEVAIEGLEDLAAIDALIKSLTAVAATLRADVDEQIKARFISEGNRTKSRPDNFTGTDGVATASCELRKKTSAAKLGIEECKRLDDLGISYETTTVKMGCYYINPAHAGNAELLGKVSEALEGVVPEDFIMFQEEAKIHTVSDKTLEMAFSKGEIENVMDIVATLALKPKTTEDMKSIVARVSKMLDENIADEDDAK